MTWIILVMAGLLEVVWAAALPATSGFTRLWPSLLFVVALTGSMLLLGKATERIPLGTAYAVWVGIGAVGAALWGILARGEAASPARLVCLVVLVGAIVGLKLTAPKPGADPSAAAARATPAP